MEPIARDVATVTVDCEPKTDPSNGNPTAAEFGKPSVSATTELSDRDKIFSRACPKETDHIDGDIDDREHKSCCALITQRREWCAGDCKEERTRDRKAHDESDERSAHFDCP